jgi:hypothetical protein
MTPELWIEIAKILIACAGGLWIYFRFVHERTLARRIEFTVDCNCFGPQGGRYVVEFLLRMKNEGRVIHRVTDLHLKVRGLKKDKTPEPWLIQPTRVAFPEKLIDEPDVIVKKAFNYIFVEPGVEQTVTFVGSLPEDIGLILVRAEFRYGDRMSHSTERLFGTEPRSSRRNHRAGTGSKTHAASADGTVVD